MKKLMIFVALIGMMIRAHAQGAMIYIVPMPLSFEVKVDKPNITLSGSEKGITYQLYHIDSTDTQIPIGEPIEGTGNPLVFKTKTDGNHSITATSKEGCMTTMDSILVVRSEKGTTYQLHKTDSTGKKVAVGKPIQGTGDPIVIGTVTGMQANNAAPLSLLKGEDYIFIVCFTGIFALMFFGIRAEILKTRRIKKFKIDLKQSWRQKLSVEQEKLIKGEKKCIECNGLVESKMIQNSYVKWTCTCCGRTYEQYSGYGSIYLMPPNLSE